MLVVLRNGGGAFGSAPVIEHLGDVKNFLGLFGGAQNEIVILAAVEFRVEAANLLGQVSPEDEEVGHVIFG